MTTGFTIVESLLAMMLLATAAAMVLSVTFPALNAAFERRDSQIARDFSKMLMAEVLSKPLTEPSARAMATTPNLIALPPDSTPVAGYVPRSEFRTIERYSGYVSKLCFIDGTPLGTNIRSAPVAGLDTLNCEIQTGTVGDNLLPGSGTRFLQITITIFARNANQNQPLNAKVVHRETMIVERKP